MKVKTGGTPTLSHGTPVENHCNNKFSAKLTTKFVKVNKTLKLIFICTSFSLSLIDRNPYKDALGGKSL